MIYNRYVANEILEVLHRPQRPNECSITTLTGAVNAVFNKHITPDDVLKFTGWSRGFVLSGKIGNQRMVKGLNKVCEGLGLQGEADVLLSTVPEDEESAEQEWTYVKACISDPNTALIYHMRNHYTLLAGYFEEPQSRNEEGKFEGRREWVIIAEASPSWKKPIRLVRWKDIYKDLRKCEGHVIIGLKKKEG